MISHRKANRPISSLRLGWRGIRGFSLIEMIAAFLIFAIGVGVLMQVLTTSLRNTRLSAHYTQAALWGQSLLDTLGVGEHIQEQQASGQFDDSYSWTLDIHKVDPTTIAVVTAASGESSPLASATEMGAETVEAADAIELYQVDLTVLWGEQPHQHQAQFTTLRVAMPDSLEGVRSPSRPPSSTSSHRTPSPPRTTR